MLNNANTILKKIIIAFLIITLTYSNFLLVGNSVFKGLISYALDNDEINNETHDEILIKDDNEIDDEVICEVTAESMDLHKTKMEEITEFTEKLNLHLKNVSNILVEDVENAFFNNENQKTENANLKYVKTTLNKEALENFLGETGTFKVLDNEENILAELSLEYINELEEQFNKETEEIKITDEIATPIQISVPQKFIKIVEIENEEGETVEEEQEEIRSYITVSEDTLEIKYELEVKEIKFNVENIKLENEDKVQEINFVIENTKSIFDVQDLDSLNYLKEDKKVLFNIEKTEEDGMAESEVENVTETEETIVENTIKFKDTITRARLETNNTEWILGEINQANYRIILDTTGDKAELFKNPTFILKLPESVQSVNSQNSQFTIENDGEIFVEKHVSIITLAGRKYVVVTLVGEQAEEFTQNGNTVIDLSLDLNVEDGEEENQGTTLFYQNDTVTAYESGAGFGTDEVNISLVLATDKNEEITENEEPAEETTEENEELLEEEITEIPHLSIWAYSSNETIIKQGEKLEYIINVANYEETDVQNVQVVDILPEGVILEKVTEITENDEKEIQYNYNEENKELRFELDKLSAAEKHEEYNEETKTTDNVINTTARTIKIYATTDMLEKGVYSKEIKNTARILFNEEIISETEYTNTISDVFIDIGSNKLNETMNEKEEIMLLLKIENKGLFDAKNVTISVPIPEQIKITSVEVEKIIENEEETLNEKTITNNNYESTIDVLAGEKYQIKLHGIVEDIDKTQEVLIKGTVNEKDVVWNTQIIDLNNKKEDTVQKDNMIEITDSGETYIGETDKDKTEQNKNNQDQTKEDEKNKETEQSANSNTSEKDKQETKKEFDLSLTQSLKKITVTNTQGTTIYNYTDTNFAKIEIPSKYMNGSLVTFEYEITVKNEGTISGYARKIADYMPSGLKFNSELNSDWYVGDDGNIYSVALIDKLLEPGTKATLKLTLTKQMTNSNTGTVTNIAEIYETSNSLNAEDINSIPGDKLDGQNDMSKVEVIIAVKTGTIIMYIVLAMITAIIVAFGIYKVNKNVIETKKGGY